MKKLLTDEEIGVIRKDWERMGRLYEVLILFDHIATLKDQLSAENAKSEYCRKNHNYKSCEEYHSKAREEAEAARVKAEEDAKEVLDKWPKRFAEEQFKREKAEARCEKMREALEAVEKFSTHIYTNADHQFRDHDLSLMLNLVHKALSDDKATP